MRLIFTPVALIVFGIAVLALLAAYRRDRIVAGTAWVLFFVAYLASTAAPVGALMRLWQVPQAPACNESHPGSTYVVLTGGASGAARQSTDIALLNQPTFRRTITAIDFAARSPGSRLLISGGAEVGLVNEAQIAREFALRLGWPAERLSIEERSFDTYTSAREVVGILQREHAAPPVLLITSASHMRRARQAYQSAGVDVLPCSTDYVDLHPIFPDSLLPTATALEKAGESWKEVAGFVVYAMRAALDRKHHG